LELLHLPLLAVIARQGSMAAAARKLRMHESKLSRHIKTLERETGLVLVVRRPAIGADPLTEDGKQLLTFAHAYAIARQQARAKANELTTRRTDRIART
jgi:molybdate transport repressor ModE-like protein